MTTNSTDTFRALVASGPATVRERWENVVQRVSAIAADEFGVVLDRETIVNLPEAKIATLSAAALDSAQVARELLALPQVIKAKAEKALLTALAAGSETAAASLPTDRASRMNEARRLGVGDGKTPAAPKTAESEAVILRRALSMSPAARISFLRREGLA